MSTIRSEYAAHEMLLDSVGVTGATARAFRAIKPAPARAARASWAQSAGFLVWFAACVAMIVITGYLQATAGT